MTTSQYMQYDANKKSTLIAYLAWFFLGIFGVHRFYLNRTRSAIIMLLLTLLVVTSIISLVWWVVDAFLIPGVVREYNSDLATRLGDGSDT